MVPLLAVSQRVDRVAGRDERRDALDQALCRWVERLGFLAVPVPNSLGPSGAVEAWIEAIAPRGILLTGGNDLTSEPDRDETERRLLIAAERRGLPLLGLCRGMQMLVHWCGGRLERVSGHVRTRHALTVEGKGEMDPPETVNSFHDFGVVDLPPTLRVLARSLPDRTIEAVRHASLPFEGWMWHPEREAVADEADLRRARALFGASGGTTGE